ncbi:MAG: winged helix-turn-helix domain-containing protein [Polyangiaceae bacterium]
MSDVPPFWELMNPMLAALRELNGEATIDALNQATAKRAKLGNEVLAVMHGDEGEQPEVFYRMGWTRTYLEKAGLFDNPRRGIWGLTGAGRETPEVDPEKIVQQVQARIEPEMQDPTLPPHLADELLSLHDRLLDRGVVRPREELEGYYRTFRSRFGPDVLASLDGQALLQAMHGRGSRDTLVYWLEFKDDEELPYIFGSISGGSALKFGMYQSAETGHWMTGSPRAQQRLTLDEASAKAREQRNQLLAGVDVLSAFPRDGSAEDYSRLQTDMLAAAPDLADSAWGHKYFSLLFPEVLDDYHAVEYQKFNLVKLHKHPIGRRYEDARFFVAAARQLGIPTTSLATTLNRRHGSPHGYWRIGTSPGDGEPSEWPRMLAGGFAAVGWDALGDLSRIEHNKTSKDELRALMAEHYPRRANVVSRATGELFKFVTTAKAGDVVVAMDGATVKGVGRLSGDYFFKADDGPFPHRRPVEWKSHTTWRLPQQEGLRTTVHRLGKHAANLIAIERELERAAMGELLRPSPPPKPTGQPAAPPPLQGVVQRIQAILRRKGQVILYGPPGTGKTYHAQRAVQELAARSWFSLGYERLTEGQRGELAEAGAIETCCFHPAYGYEDFLEGYRPTATDGALAFERRDGIFKKLCDRASQRTDRAFYLLIDEFNRGDVPRIFGELLTVLEKDKREVAVTLPLSGAAFAVPKNVFLVATMNTADRSVALLDAALRRRFGFIELMPDSGPLARASVGSLPLGEWLDALNKRVLEHAGRDARNLQIGHAYLMHGAAPIEDVARFAEVLRDDVIPLLEEYCYENYDALAAILGPQIVDRRGQRIHDALFRPAAHDDLIQALLTSFDGITATTAAVEATAELDTDEEDVDDDATEEDDDA